MVSIEDLIDDLAGPRAASGRIEQPQTGEVFGAEGLAFLDYGDPDHVFRVAVTLVPRRRLSVPDGAVCEVEGVEVRLVEVAVANDITVSVEGLPGLVHDQVLEEYRAAYDRWVRPAADGAHVGDRPPPPFPAERLAGIVGLTDDQGTAYRLRRGQAGGHGTEWSASASFDPLPPPGARTLRVEFFRRGIVVGGVALDLSAGQVEGAIHGPAAGGSSSDSAGGPEIQADEIQADEIQAKGRSAVEQRLRVVEVLIAGIERRSEIDELIRASEDESSLREALAHGPFHLEGFSEDMICRMLLQERSPWRLRELHSERARLAHELELDTMLDDLGLS